MFFRFSKKDVRCCFFEKLLQYSNNSCRQRRTFYKFNKNSFLKRNTIC